MISKHLFLRLTPRERAERRKCERNKLWKQLNEVHHFEQNDWLKKRAKIESEQIASHLVSKYRVIYNLIDINGDGSLQLTELIAAFKYCGVRVTEYELRKDLNI